MYIPYTSTIVTVVLLIFGIVFLYLMVSNYFRINDTVAKLGGRVKKIRFTPFGEGWYGHPHALIYQVDYYDSEGNLHSAVCHTKFFHTAYFFTDKIVAPNVNPQPPGE